MEQYQDIWTNGKLQVKGVRECEARWEVIRDVAARFRRPFTVLDVGANLGYFSIRLAEEFDCTVVAVEGAYGDWLRRILQENQIDRVLLLEKVFSLQDLEELAAVEHFDLTLALSVAHHFDCEYDGLIAALRDMGSVLVMENAVESNACRSHILHKQFIPDDAEIIGAGASHLAAIDRPIFAMEQEKRSIKRAYLGSPNDDIAIEIDATYDRKVVSKLGVQRDWHRGINLKTWLEKNGSYPSKSHVRSLCEKSRPKSQHGDLKIHNAILQGENVVFIDALDHRRRMEDDEACFKQILSALDG